MLNDPNDFIQYKNFNNLPYIGFDKWFDNVVNDVFSHYWDNTSYPPINYIDLGGGKYKLEFAVAGFSKDEIEITELDGVLTIKGKKEKSVQEKPKYLFQGLASRQFTRKFVLNKDFEIGEVLLKDGILSVEFKNIKKEPQARKIDIP